MRTFRHVIIATLAVAALLAAATPTFAQSTPAAPKQQGLGIFLQGGYTFTEPSGDLKDVDFKPQGFLVGVGFGGNKSGAFGVGVDVNYIWLTDKDPDGGDSVKNQILDIPVYARFNIGGHNTKNAFTFYIPAGWFFDVLMSSKSGSTDIKDLFNSFQTGPLVGVGMEVARIAVEFRAQWAVMDLLKDGGTTNPAGKVATYIVLLKVRLN